MTKHILRLLVTSFCVVGLAAPVVAQQTGAGGDTSSTDSASNGGLVSKIKDYAEKAKSPDADDEPEGFYPRLGGLTTGSGLALGGGYRTHFVDRAFYADLSGVVSTKAYVGLDGRLRVPSPASWLELWTSVAYRRFTQEDYFGLGFTSLEADRSNYAITSTDIGGEAIVKLTPAFHVGAGLGYFMPKVGPGKDDKFPSTELIFSDASAPGLLSQPDFLHVGVFAALDTRDAPGNPRAGGKYEATLARWNDRDLGDYSFNRFDLDLAHYLPLGSPRHVLVGRAGVSYVNNGDGERVPFYVFPYVGGFNTVRSLNEFRFRDENAMFLSGEYRLGVHKYVQLATFLDGGKVAHDWGDIDFSGLKKGYGVGVRAGTERRTFIRVDVATGGDEGTRWYFKLMPSW